MRPKFLNPSTYNNLDIREIDANTVIVHNVDPYNMNILASGVDLKFIRFYGYPRKDVYRTKGDDNYYEVTGTIDGMPSQSDPIVVWREKETTDMKDLFEYILGLARKQDDQFRKNCFARILSVLDGPDSAAYEAAQNIVFTPRELNQ